MITTHIGIYVIQFGKEGICGRRLSYITVRNDEDTLLKCVQAGVSLSREIIAPGNLVECVKCLTEVCSDLAGNKLERSRY